MRKISTVKVYKTKWWEELLYSMVVIVMLSRLNLFAVYSYVVAKNLFYSMCRVAEHDLVESAITNHLDVVVYGSGGSQQEGEPSDKKNQIGEKCK